MKRIFSTLVFEELDVSHFLVYYVISFRKIISTRN